MANLGWEADGDYVTQTSSRTVADIVTRLAEMIEGKGMRLFATIDQAAEARRVGLGDRPGVGACASRSSRPAWPSSAERGVAHGYHHRCQGNRLPVPVAAGSSPAEPVPTPARWVGRFIIPQGGGAPPGPCRPSG